MPVRNSSLQWEFGLEVPFLTGNVYQGTGALAVDLI
jgi:hypothetical protein